MGKQIRMTDDILEMADSYLGVLDFAVNPLSVVDESGNFVGFDELEELLMHYRECDVLLDQEYEHCLDVLQKNKAKYEETGTC